MNRISAILRTVCLAGSIMGLTAFSATEDYLIEETSLNGNGESAYIKQALLNPGTLTLSPEDITSGMDLSADLNDPYGIFITGADPWSTTSVIDNVSVWPGTYRVEVENSGTTGTFDTQWSVQYDVSQPPNSVTVTVGTMLSGENSETISVAFSSPSDPDSGDYIKTVYYYCNDCLAGTNTDLGSTATGDSFTISRNNPHVQSGDNEIYVIVEDCHFRTTTSSTATMSVVATDPPKASGPTIADGSTTKSVDVSLGWDAIWHKTWEPDDDELLLGWWAPEDTDHIITRTDGRISDWTAKAGTGTFEEWTEEGPEYGVRQVNGRFVADFDGANPDGMGLADYEVGYTAIFACVAIVDGTDTQYDSIMSYYYSSDETWLFRRHHTSVNGYIDASFMDNLWVYNKNAWDGNPHIIVTEFVSDGEFNIYIDGWPARYYAHYRPLLEDMPTVGRVGMMMNGGSALYRADGAMMDFVLSNSVDPTNRQNLEGYLAHKWGLAANLPADHPYKTSSTTYNVYFGTDSGAVNTATYLDHPNVDLNTVTVNCFDPGSTLEYNTVYYWRVDTVANGMTTKGDVWMFRTPTTMSPPQTTSPSPGNTNTNVPLSGLEMEWMQGSYTPASDSSLLGWWDPTDSAKITESNGIVSKWDASAGTCIDTSYESFIANGISGPVLDGSRTLNDTNVLDFNEANGDGMKVGDQDNNIFFNIGGPTATFACVVIVDNADSVYDAFFSYHAPGAGWRFRKNNTLTGLLGISDALADDIVPSINVCDGNAHICVVEIESGQNATVYVDGHKAGCEMLTGTLSTSGILGMMIGNYDTQNLDGAMMDYVVTTSVDSDNRQQLEGYLAQKWGLGANLPNDHPYAGTYEIYIGTDQIKVTDADADDHTYVYRTTSSTKSYQPGADPNITLAYDQTYYWRVDTVANGLTTQGPVWSFTTEAAPVVSPPQTASPSPSSGDENQALNLALEWELGSYTPASDSDLLGWWDPTDSAKITVSNGIVSEWEASAGTCIGTSYESFTANGISGPILDGSRTLNNIQVFDFNEANGDGMINSNFNLNGSTATFACVAIADSANSGWDGLFSYTGTNSWILMDAGLVNGKLYLSDSIADDFYTSANIFDGNPHICVVEIISGGNATLYIDGNKAGSTLVTGTLSTIGNLGMMVGAFVEHNIDGAMMDYVVTSSTDTENRQNLEGYLARKWGLEANLPGTHPYAGAYEIYIGTDQVQVTNATEASHPGVYMTTSSTNSYQPDTDPNLDLANNQTYYWRVDTVANGLRSLGAVWSFTVGWNPTSNDADSLSDDWEVYYGLDGIDDALVEDMDSDGDNISNLNEYLQGTNPNDASSNDADSLSDDWELYYGLDLIDDTLVELSDSDSDGASNLLEYVAGTDPTDDTDTPTNVPSSISLTTSGPIKEYPGKSIALQAEVEDLDYGIDRVEFYADSVLIGTDYLELSAPTGVVTANTTWSTGTSGTYSITAKAIDLYGDESISSPVSVEIVTDTDGDLLPDDWEMSQFGDLDQNELDDMDNDGLPEIFEYHYSKDPTDSTSLVWRDSEQSTSTYESPIHSVGTLHAYWVDASVSGAYYTRTTIGSVLPNVIDFDIIQVEPGVYRNLDSYYNTPRDLVLTKSVYIFSSEGAGSTSIVTQVRVEPSNEVKLAAINGFEIRPNLTIDQYALSINHRYSQANEPLVTASITGCVFPFATDASQKHGAIDVYRSDVTLISCIISDTREFPYWEGQLSGIGLQDASIKLINTIVDNKFYIEPKNWGYDRPSTIISINSLVRDEATGRLFLDGVDQNTDFLGLTPYKGIHAASIAADAGTSAAYTLRDFDNEVRSDGLVDIGADEVVDADSNGMADAWEDYYGITSATADPDGDGLNNLGEYQNMSDPGVADTDGDTISDGNEATLGTSPANFNKWENDLNQNGIEDINDLLLGYSLVDSDTDGDGLSNTDELTVGTDPCSSDTDGDGVSDYTDVFPLDPVRTGIPTPINPPAIELNEPSNAILL